MWTVTIPAGIFLWFGLIRDNIRYTCIPVMIATVIFQVLITVLAVVIIVNCLISGNHWVVRFAHWVNLAVLAYSSMIALCYKYNYAKRDLLKGDDNEI